MAIRVRIDSCRDAFDRAMTALIRSTGCSSISDTMRAWHDNYGGYILHDGIWTWSEIAFANEEQRTLFLLRWS